MVEVLAAWVLVVVAKAVHGELSLLALEQHPPQMGQMAQTVEIIFLDVERAVVGGLAITPMGVMVGMAEFQAVAVAVQVVVITVTAQ